MSAFIDEHRERFGVEPICRTLGVSASAYYQRATGERSAREVEDERLTDRIREVHSENFECYGCPRVWHELRRQGEQAGRDRVARLMRQEGIRGAKRRGKPWRTTTPDPEAEKRPDLVKRDFAATAPDRLWVGDRTSCCALPSQLLSSRCCEDRFNLSKYTAERPRTTRRCSTIIACWRRSARSETASTTRSPNRLWTPTRPS